MFPTGLVEARSVLNVDYEVFGPLTNEGNMVARKWPISEGAGRLRPLSLSQS